MCLSALSCVTNIVLLVSAPGRQYRRSVCHRREEMYRCIYCELKGSCMSTSRDLTLVCSPCLSAGQHIVGVETACISRHALNDDIDMGDGCTFVLNTPLQN
ncbi:unnamed protein product, partial [Hapterophycus canaliculatus]